MSIDISYRHILQVRKQALLPEVRKLANEGHDCRTISIRLGVSTTTVRKWLRELGLSPIKRPAKPRPIKASQVIARYKTIYREAMQEWRSARAANQVSTADESTGDGGRLANKRQSTRTAGRSVNCALLARAMDALQAIREIKGLDAPRKTEIARDGIGRIYRSTAQVKDLPLMSDKALFALKVRPDADVASAEAAQESPPPLAEK